ncbi:MAG: tRNA (adenosine(37)-N6)-dimethylallyltransferase MiaA [Bacteroidota bacterium]
MTAPSAHLRVLVLVGPTASGKSDIALVLARLLKGEIVSADARQIYRGMDCGTAKPSHRDRTAVPHHMIDIRYPHESYSAAAFAREGREAVAAILGAGALPLIVGGSGLYVRALVDGLSRVPASDPEVRTVLQDRLQAEGLAELVRELERVDPHGAARMDTRNPRRVLRALEVHRTTGIPLSRFQLLAPEQPPFTSVFFGMKREREDLYRRIDLRCDRMLEEGLLEETRSLLASGVPAGAPALAAPGYAEALRYLEGEISRDEMVRLFKQSSRRYARRQMTWFGRDRRIWWMEVEKETPPGETARAIADGFLQGGI